MVICSTVSKSFLSVAYLSLVTVAVAVGVLLKTDFNLSSVYLYYRHFLLLFTSLAVVLSVFLYVKSFWAKKTQLNPHGTTGYYVVDFIRGRELNPRIGSFDLKFFLFRIGIVSIVSLFNWTLFTLSLAFLFKVNCLSFGFRI